MQKTTTLIRLKLFFGKMLLFLVILAFAAGKLSAQPFINGNLSTGATSSNGTAAPAGYTWSELQAGGNIIGFGVNIIGGTGGAMLSVADDFTVPTGAGWDVTKFTCYAYSTNFAGSTSPFTDIRLQIFNTDPSVGSPTPVFGNMTTNRFSASSDALMYRITTTAVNTTRKIWKIEANIVPSTLGPGHYWIEWSLGNGGLSNFSPPSTVAGTNTQPGVNGKAHDFGGVWSSLLDTPPGTNTPQDMPFRLDYTIVPPPPCTGATAAVISSQNVKFNEGFNTSVVFPGDPTPPGWVHVNKSNPIGGTSFYSGVQAGVFASNSGADYLAANFNNTTAGGTTSNWMISPLTSINNGDVFSFYSRTAAPSAGFPDRLQVRMSTNGASTDVGTTATSTGDFGTLLLDINPTYTTAYPEAWTKFTVTISGVPAGGTNGRIAFRYFIEPSSGATGNYIGIDDAVYTSNSTPVVCSGTTGNIKVDITGGVGPFTVVYNAAPGGNVTVNNYNSGANIAVTPTANTTYTLVSVTGFDGCLGAGLSGSAAINTTTGSTAAVLSQVQVSFPPVDPTTCTGSTANLKVNITGGTGPYTVTITPTAPAGAPIVVTGYTSGTSIPVTPAVSTTYALTSVVSSIGCIGTGNSGTPTITVSATPIAPILITAAPSGPLCAGSPTLLSVALAPITPSFSNTAPVLISAGPLTGTGAGPAFPYPANVTVSGLPTSGVTVKSVTLSNISHTFSSDLDILLQSPTGQNIILMSDFGGGNDFVNATLTFDDAGVAMTSTNPMPSGTFKCVNTAGPDNFVAPGPGSVTNINPTLATFTGDLNGGWKLFVVDQFSQDTGRIAGGYSIKFNIPGGAPSGGYTYSWSPAAGLSSTTTNPVAASPMTTTTYTVLATAPGGCQTTAQITINVNQLPAVNTPPSNLTVCENGTATFTGTFSGASASPQWQVSTTGAGGPWTDLTNAAPYSGVTSGTLTIAPVTFAMNGYQYRLKVSGTCPPFAVSTGAVLTVNAAPVVTATPASPICGGIAGTNGTLITASGASTFTWSPATGLYLNATATIPYVAGTPATSVYAAPTANTTYTVTGTNGTTGCTATFQIAVNYKPVITAIPASATICAGPSYAAAPLSINSALTSTFSSGPISVVVPDIGDGAAGISTIAVSGIPANATISGVKVTFSMLHNYVGDVDINIQAPNGKNLNLVGGLNGGAYNNSTHDFTNTAFSSLGGATISGAPAPRTGTFAAEARPFYGPDLYIQNTTTWSSLTPTGTSANGNWIFAVGDWGAGDQGTIKSWSIDITYGLPTAGVWTPNSTVAAGLYTDPGATILYTGTPAITVYAKPATSTTYNVTVTSVGPDATPTFSNPASIATGDGSPGNPYSSNIAVTGLPTSGAVVSSVKLIGVSHGWSDDVDVLLQSPTGQNVVLMSDVGFGNVLANNTFTFSDAGPLMTTGATPSGTYHPTNLVDPNFGVEPDNWPAPGPGTFAQTAPALGLFTGDFNGAWKLFVVDDATPDAGSISGGYSITFKYPTVGCVSNVTQVPVTVNQPITFNPALPADAAVCTDKVTSFTSGAGGSVVNHNWQFSAQNGNLGTWVNIANGGIYAGANTATLTITAPPVSISGYLYRDSVHTTACRDSISRIARLTVNPLPTIVIGASPTRKLFPGITTTLFSTVSPIAATYTWLKSGVAVPGANASSYLVTVDGIGDYTLRVTDVNGCTNTSNQVSITDSVTGRVFVYPNPNTGVFQVRYYSIVNNTNLPRGINIYDARGKRVATKAYSIAAPYARMDVDLRNYGTGVYWLEVVDVSGNRLAMGRVDVIR